MKQTIRAQTTVQLSPTFTSSGSGKAESQGIQIMDLSAIVDTLSEDGQRAQVAGMRMDYVLQSSGILNTSKQPVSIYFGVLQTAGMITTPFKTYTTQEIAVLAGMTEDVFGFQRITQPKMQEPFWDLWINDGQGDYHRQYKVKGTINIPANVVSLLNKESETERLQNLHLVCIMTRPLNSDSTNPQIFHGVATVDYTLKKNPIRIR